MNRLMVWLKTDISVLSKPKSKKLGLKQQRKVIQLFNNLMQSGFTLTEMVDFLKRSQLLADHYTEQMRASLLSGRGLPDMMAGIGFSDAIVTQISLADVHGNTQKCLLKIEKYLAQMAIVKKKLIEVATYPIILLSFLVFIMLGLKNYLLPQLEKGNLATQLINHFPSLFLLGLVINVLVGGGLYLISKRVPALVLAGKLSQIPLFGKFVQLYLTAYYAREWGNLLGQGVELAQIVKLMQDQKASLFQEIGRDMEKGLMKGQAFHQQVLAYPFFLRELSLMIEYGEVKSKLGSELEIYAAETWETFFSRLNRATQFIQPIIFLLVALVIVMIYAAMLLPMYQNMEVNL
ncbi:competence type IV pilus assembly protein ComGB [Streptococcus caballi]|uniref:competence type IV pilus assembly protein ComGB n=1 Tax=Streptococcus caballi TaxID=439220 RepID=UPI0012E9CA34|nr:competence type IV pilus assembly protein ComGB [Streptococcus caballi]